MENLIISWIKRKRSVELWKMIARFWVQGSKRIMALSWANAEENLIWFDFTLAEDEDRKGGFGFRDIES